MNQGDAIDAVNQIVDLAEKTAAFYGLTKGADYDLIVAFSFEAGEVDKVVQIDPAAGIAKVLGIVQIRKPGEDEPTVAIIPCLTLTYFENQDVLTRLALMLSNYIYRIVSDEEHHTIEMLYTVESLTVEEAARARAGMSTVSRALAEGLELSFDAIDPLQLDSSED